MSGETNVRLMVVSKAFIDGDKADYALEQSQAERLMVRSLTGITYNSLYKHVSLHNVLLTTDYFPPDGLHGVDADADAGNTSNIL